ncbi:MAG: hypothetical protein MI861_27665, partial [Pirellulales bacterium]|nr:hypothetical protein [Pirellulales bacterium]
FLCFSVFRFFARLLFTRFFSGLAPRFLHRARLHWFAARANHHGLATRAGNDLHLGLGLIAKAGRSDTPQEATQQARGVENRYVT